MEHVATEQPESFERLVRAFSADVIARPAPPERDEGRPASVTVTLSPSTSGTSLRRTISKHTPGTMPNPLGRYETEAPDAPEGEEKPLSPRNSSHGANPNRRGRMVPGTMPHPAARFDFVPDDAAGADAQVTVLTLSSQYFSHGLFLLRATTHPALSTFSLTRTPRFPPCVLNLANTHRISRFLAPQEDAPSTQQSQFARRPPNPNSKGRIVGGTMPHPGSRFELPVDDYADEVCVACAILPSSRTPDACQRCLLRQSSAVFRGCMQVAHARARACVHTSVLLPARIELRSDSRSLSCSLARSWRAASRTLVRDRSTGGCPRRRRSHRPTRTHAVASLEARCPIHRLGSSLTCRPQSQFNSPRAEKPPRVRTVVAACLLAQCRIPSSAFTLAQVDSWGTCRQPELCSRPEVSPTTFLADVNVWMSSSWPL
jgi:hypothetical protein